MRRDELGVRLGFQCVMPEQQMHARLRFEVRDLDRNRLIQQCVNRPYGDPGHASSLSRTVNG
jgi:hypothetical protein